MDHLPLSNLPRSFDWSQTPLLLLLLLLSLLLLQCPTYKATIVLHDLLMTFLERWLALEHLFAQTLLLLLLNGVHWHPNSPPLFLVKLAYLTLLAA